jgi:fatty-acyl-CoA synthase
VANNSASTPLRPLLGDAARIVKVLRQVGLLRAQNPVRGRKALQAIRSWGPGFPGGVHSAAARQPDQLAVIDELGELTWRQVADEVNRTTRLFQQRGIKPGDGVALLGRNHRHLMISLVACMQAGARVLLLNTMASKEQLNELAAREGAELLVLDEEFVERLDQDTWGERILLGWVDGDSTLPSMAAEAARFSADDVELPAEKGRIVIFTSGTTGLPKGARRREPKNLLPLVSMFDAIPYPANQRVVLSAPLFHSWGLLNFGFSLVTTPTYILRRRFDPEQVLADIERYQATTLVVVPLMMQRLVDADPEAIAERDVSSLSITATSGSALPGELATRFMDLFTDSIYNFYGATETGWVTIANPEDLRAAPGTAGRPPMRTTVRILNDEGHDVAAGDTGVIYVTNDMLFGGYTDGRNKPMVDGLMNTGDRGFFDEHGRLFVSGRDDDMVISGGENVFPRELEDKLIDHPDVADTVVVGIDDREWGQRLAAYVVRQPGSSVTEEELIEFSRHRVARFAVPGRVQFVDALPRNPTGKVMRRELPPFDQ